MKNRNLENRTTQLVFARWSNKAYAVFASLSQCVKIAGLRALVCDCALRKAKASTLPIDGFVSESSILSKDEDLLEIQVYNLIDILTELTAVFTSIDNNKYTIFTLNLIKDLFYALAKGRSFFCYDQRY